MTDTAPEPTTPFPGPREAVRAGPPAAGVPGTRPHDRERRAIADRISEDVMQLLYTARQDLAELDAQGPGFDAGLLRSARDCTTGAISILRGVVATVLTAAWGPAPDEDADWARSAVLFDVLGDAWVITCEDDDLLYASRAACEVLGHTPDQLAALMQQPGAWPRRLAEAPRSAADDGRLEFQIDVPLESGGIRTIHVASHPLPTLQDVAPSYISRLTAQER